MKKRMFMMLLLGAIALGTTKAQTCTAYYPIKEGTMTEMTSYDAKGKVHWSTPSTVGPQSDTADGLIGWHKKGNL